MASTTQRQIIVVADEAALAETAARRLMSRHRRGTGRCRRLPHRRLEPEGLYRLLAEEPWRGKVPWDRVHWFMGDDRFVPESRSAAATWAWRAGCFSIAVRRRAATFIRSRPTPTIPKARPISTQTSSRTFYGADQLDPARPLFDLVLMGLGPDGHIASLFPQSRALDEKERWVVGVAKAGMEPFVPRVTLTFPALASTREMLFLVDGADKRDILHRVFAGDDLPAARAYCRRRSGLAARPRRGAGGRSWLIAPTAAPSVHRRDGSFRLRQEHDRLDARASPALDLRGRRLVSSRSRTSRRCITASR